MPTFTPPTDNLLGMTLPLDPGASQEVRLAHRLFRHFAASPRGRNVFKLNSGTYTETQPGDMSTVAITYLGAHIYTITSAEATALTTAGYGANIT